jgi:hypothetical protein
MKRIDLIVFAAILFCFDSLEESTNWYFYSLTYIKRVCMTIYFLPQDGLKTPSSTKFIEGAVGDPQVIVVATTALLLNNKILQQNPVGI